MRSIDLKYGLWAAVVVLLLISVLGMWMLKDATPYGLGLRTDSAQYIYGARNLLAGDGYTRTSGAGELKPITHFPPMFSSLITLVSLSGLEALRSARLLVILLFGGGILLFGILVYRLTRSKGFSLAGAFLFATSAVFLEVYAWVMSEPLYLFLWLGAFLLLDFYWQYRKTGLLVLLGVFCGTAYLTRYIGLSLFVTCVFVLFLAESGWKQKWRSLILTTTPFLLFLLSWSIRNILVIGAPTNRRLAFHLVPYQKIAEGIDYFWDWLLPDGLAFFSQQYPIVFQVIFYLLLLAGLAALAVELFKLLRGQKTPAGISTSGLTLLAVSLSAIVYLASTLVSISFYDAATAFENRILMPVFLPVLALILVGLTWLFRRKGIVLKLVAVAVILVVSWFSYQGARVQVYLLGRDGMGYANTTLRGSEVIDVIKAMPSELIIYTNEPQLIYLVADRDTYISPIFFDSVTSEYRESYAADLRLMHMQINQHQAVLVYFYEPDYATDEYFLELTAGLKPIGEYPFAFIFGPKE